MNTNDLYPPDQPRGHVIKVSLQTKPFSSCFFLLDSLFYILPSMCPSSSFLLLRVFLFHHSFFFILFPLRVFILTSFWESFFIPPSKSLSSSSFLLLHPFSSQSVYSNILPSVSPSSSFLLLRVFLFHHSFFFILFPLRVFILTSFSLRVLLLHFSF